MYNWKKKSLFILNIKIIQGTGFGLSLAKILCT
jgi:hypothetical protein